MANLQQVSFQSLYVQTQIQIPFLKESKCMLLEISGVNDRLKIDSLTRNIVIISNQI